MTEARVNQQPPMHQLAVLSTGWAAYFHLVSDGVHHSPFIFAADQCTFFFLVFSLLFFPGPDFTHSYLAHLLTLINIVQTLVPY